MPRGSARSSPVNAIDVIGLADRDKREDALDQQQRTHDAVGSPLQR
jgi:hypothetical protein